MEVAVITICLLVGITCAMLASSKRRSAIGWFVIGSLLPVIGLVLILILPAMSGGFAVMHTPGGYQEPNATIVARRTHMQSATLDAVIRLVELRERGELTRIEFEEKKSELLARI